MPLDGNRQCAAPAARQAVRPRAGAARRIERRTIAPSVGVAVAPPLGVPPAVCRLRVALGAGR